MSRPINVVLREDFGIDLADAGVCSPMMGAATGIGEALLDAVRDGDVTLEGAVFALGMAARVLVEAAIAAGAVDDTPAQREGVQVLLQLGVRQKISATVSPPAGERH